MEVALKRLTENGAFDNAVLHLTHQKGYFDGSVAQNDYAQPTVSLHHCIFHYNSNGFFVEIVDIGLFKYQEADDETFRDVLGEEGLSDMTTSTESELEDATSVIEVTEHEENWRSIPTEELFNLEVSRKIEKELTLDEETEEISLHYVYSPIHMTIDEEYSGPLFPLNPIGETLTDPNPIVEISRNPETYIVSNKQSEISDGISRKQNISKSPRELSKQLNISNNENSFHSKNDGEQFLSKLNKRSIQTMNLERDTKTKILERLNVGNSENSMNVIQTRSMQKLFKESFEQFKTDSVRKPGNHSVQKLRTELSSPERKLKTESVQKLETKFVQHLGIDSVINLHTEFSSSDIKLPGVGTKVNETVQLPVIKKLESSNEESQDEIDRRPSTRNVKSCQEGEKRLPDKRLFVTLIDILKNPISDFPSKKELPSHSENIIEKPKPTIKRKRRRRPFNSRKKKVFRCSFCHKNLSSKKSLGIHKKVHTLENPYSCEKCGKNFVTNSLLQRHLVTHTKDRFFSCAICEKTFKSKSDVRQHLMIHAWLKFKCKECFRLFFRKSDLLSHMKYHTNATEYKCLQCDKSDNVKSVLNSHVRKIHTRMGLHKCNVCEKMFLDKIAFGEHNLIHTGERPLFACDVCKKTFRGKKILRFHMRYLHVSKFTCNECENFPNKDNLRKHLRIHLTKELRNFS